MKIASVSLFIVFIVCSSAVAETVNKGDYFAWKFARDSLAYVDGDFMSWRTNEADDNYEFKQHFIWTDEELTNIMNDKKVKFNQEEIKSFFEIYEYNLTDSYYLKKNGKKEKGTKQIDISASLFELYDTCFFSNINEEKCRNLYVKAYENSVKKFNTQSSKQYRTYNTYGPLKLPITALVQTMFEQYTRTYNGNRLCQAGKVTPETVFQTIKVVETDSIAICSYSENSDKYKCTMNRFYNTSYRCTISCEGVFFLQEKDLRFDGKCSDAWIIPKSRPSLLDIYGSDEYIDTKYDVYKDKKIEKVQKKVKRDY